MDKRIIKALNFIEANLDQTVNLDKVASEVALSPFHFHRLFKKETGSSLKKFVESMKIEKAFFLIQSPQTKVLETALALGFNDYETFSRAFKRKYKVSPDDLKSVIVKARTEAGAEEDGQHTFMVVTHDSQDTKELAKKIKKKLSEHKVDSSSEVRTFIITRKTATSTQPKQTIKNKFTMTSENKIWKSILAQLRAGAMILAVAGLAAFTAGPSSETKSNLEKQADPGEKTLSDFLAQKGYHAISLKKYITGHLYTEVVLNGVKGNFILDTGAGATVVEEKRKDKFKMTSAKAEEKAVGAGGSGMELQKSLNNQFHLAAYKMESFNAMLMNLDHVNVAFKQLGLEEIDGVIGADILTNGNAIIDYINLTLYLKK